MANVGLNAIQEAAVNAARRAGGRDLVCLGAAEGGFLYFWTFESGEEGFVVLPIPEAAWDWDEDRFYGYGSGYWYYRTFSREGHELTPPFVFLVHWDLREIDKENVWANCPWPLNLGSYLPERAATRLGVEARRELPWVGHSWVDGGEHIPHLLLRRAVAITILLPDGRRIEVV